MERKRLLAVALLAAIACGGDAATGVNNGGSNLASEPLSAVINGVQWGSPLPAATYGKNSILSIAGLDAALTASVSVAVIAPSTGTYSLAYQNPNFATAGVSKVSQGWSTGFAGGTGSVTITTLTANHVVGTFAFTAVPGSGGATGTIQVTNGKFDITF
jgi:hypothetical protein